MKVSLKSSIIILALLLGTFAVVKLTKRGSKSKTLKTELISVDPEKTSKAEITSPKGKVTLTREDSVWMVQGEGQTRITKKEVVEGMLQTLSTIKPGRLAARKKEKWKDYAVDSTGTRVVLYEGEEVVSDLVLGRFGMEGQKNFHTYVRLYEDDEVYTANDFMKMSVYETVDDYRDNVLLRLSKDSLTSITFNFPDSSYQLTKNDQWYLAGQVADSASVAGYLRDLNYLASKQFHDLRPSSRTHEVRFSFSNSSDISINGTMTAEGMIVTTSENMKEAFLDSEVAEKAFKGKDVFATTNE